MSDSEKKGSWLSGPLTVAFVAGIIALSGVVFQLIDGRSARATAREQQLLDAKQQVFNNFSNGIVQYLYVSDSTLHRRVWLMQNRDAENKAVLRYADERSFVETRDAFEQGMSEMKALPQPDALCAQASAMFVSDDAKAKVTRLSKLLERYVAASDSETIESVRDQIDTAYAEAVAAMGTELRGAYEGGYASAAKVK